MRNVPGWGMVSSVAAPVVLVGGWTVAAALQPASFDPVKDTVSALAAPGATDRWVMTTVFLAVGICYLGTAAALRPAGPAARLIMMAGAAGGMLVAASPAPAGGSLRHAVFASIGFAGLAAWPAWAWQRGRSVPWGLRPAACLASVAVQLVSLAWFVAELITASGQAGLAERVVGAEQALWPLAVVLSCRLSGTGNHALTQPAVSAPAGGLEGGRSIVSQPGNELPGM